MAFGDGIISTIDTCFACETREDLFSPVAPHGPMGLDGVEIFTNCKHIFHLLSDNRLISGTISQRQPPRASEIQYAYQPHLGGDEKEWWHLSLRQSDRM